MEKKGGGLSSSFFVLSGAFFSFWGIRSAETSRGGKDFGESGEGRKGPVSAEEGTGGALVHRHIGKKKGFRKVTLETKKHVPTHTRGKRTGKREVFATKERRT